MCYDIGLCSARFALSPQLIRRYRPERWRNHSSMGENHNAEIPAFAEVSAPSKYRDRVLLSVLDLAHHLRSMFAICNEPIFLLEIANMLKVSNAVLATGAAQTIEADHSPQLLITKHSPSFWRVTLDNPPINLMGPEMISGLQELMDVVELDQELKVIVFDSANDDYFVSHFDVLRGAEVPMVSGKLGVQQWVDVSNRLHNAGVISIAAVRGRVRGIGSEFILACDLRFASREKALFGHLEVGMGLLPGGGAAEYLPRLSGYARALEIAVSADDYSAETAELYGWINRAFPDAELDGFVTNLASRISTFELPALRATKATLLKRSGGGPSPFDIQESTNKFFELYQRPQAQHLLEKLMGMGFQTPGDTERRLGHHLGTLAR
jgi:enoyl-CoA hydratase/carnithine racemase